MCCTGHFGGRPRPRREPAWAPTRRRAGNPTQGRPERHCDLGIGAHSPYRPRTRTADLVCLPRACMCMHGHGHTRARGYTGAGVGVGDCAGKGQQRVRQCGSVRAKPGRVHESVPNLPTSWHSWLLVGANKLKSPLRSSFRCSLAAVVVAGDCCSGQGWQGMCCCVVPCAGWWCQTARLGSPLPMQLCASRMQSHGGVEGVESWWCGGCGVVVVSWVRSRSAGC